MPLEIQRTALVYRLWDDADLAALFEAHADADWLCTMTCGKEDGVVVWRVGLQNTAARQHITATRDQVIVSDLSTAFAQTVEYYNAANPGNMIEVGS
jgi:hypothetical protein